MNSFWNTHEKKNGFRSYITFRSRDSHFNLTNVDSLTWRQEICIQLARAWDSFWHTSLLQIAARPPLRLSSWFPNNSTISPFPVFIPLSLCELVHLFLGISIASHAIPHRSRYRQNQAFFFSSRKFCPRVPKVLTEYLLHITHINDESVDQLILRRTPLRIRYMALLIAMLIAIRPIDNRGKVFWRPRRWGHDFTTYCLGLPAIADFRRSLILEEGLDWTLQGVGELRNTSSFHLLA